MNIFALPSWYVTPQDPFSGIFFREQIELMLRENLSLTAFVSAGQYLSLSPRNLKKSSRSLAVYIEGKVQKNDIRISERGRLIESFSPILRTSKRFMDGNIHSAVKKARYDFQSFQKWNGDPDAIVAFSVDPGGIIGSTLSNEFGVPLVLIEHMGPIPIPAWLDHRGRPHQSVTDAWRQADTLVAVSSKLSSDLAPLCGGRSIEVLHNPLPRIFEETAVEILRSNKSHKRSRMILAVSRLLRSKGIEELLIAFATMGQGAYHLEVIGHGPDKDHFEELARKLDIGSRVVFLGPKSREAVRDKMKQAAFLVMPSHSETFSIVCIEALACGTPVVATDCGGPADIVNDESGILVPPKNVEALSNAMEDMINSSQDFSRSKLAAAALSRFGARAFCEKLSNIIERSACAKEWK